MEARTRKAGNERKAEGRTEGYMFERKGGKEGKEGGTI